MTDKEKEILRKWNERFNAIGNDDDSDELNKLFDYDKDLIIYIKQEFHASTKQVIHYVHLTEDEEKGELSILDCYPRFMEHREVSEEAFRDWVANRWEIKAEWFHHWNIEGY